MDTWSVFFEEEQRKNYFIELMQYLDQAYEKEIVYPKKMDLFRCFQLCPLKDVKVVILGQDPYHQEGQANGLSFSLQKGIPLTPSIKNIFKELHDDEGIDTTTHGDLSAWAEQGVFLMNAIMSVKANHPLSHAGIGWEIFSDHVMQVLNASKSGIVFVLWGNYAQQKKTLIDGVQHHIICSPHPSPLSAYRGFFKSRPFSRCNTYLSKIHRGEIDWGIFT